MIIFPFLLSAIGIFALVTARKGGHHHNATSVASVTKRNATVVDPVTRSNFNVSTGADPSLEDGSLVNPGLVVIVLSHGRSGSTELCSLVGNLVGGLIQGEIFGGSAVKMSNIADPVAHMLEHLKNKQSDEPGKVIGFKWKPYYDEQYHAVWDWVSRHQVKVVYNYRNPLDVYISNRRAHALGVYNCAPGDDKCLEAQLAVQVNVTVSELVSSLDQQRVDSIGLIAKLSARNVSYYDITYEEVNIGDMVDRIARVQLLANFLQPGKVVSSADFEVRSQYIGHVHQRDSVVNYDEMEKALNGTRFARYLH
jgi:hypothetical protein